MGRVIRWLGATLAGVLILGVIGVAGAAPASAYTRRAVIVNDTTYSLTLSNVRELDRYGCNGGDQFMPVGTVVGAGTVYYYEKTWYFGVTCTTELTFTFVNRHGARDYMRIDLQVDGWGNLSAYVHHHDHIRVEHGQPGTVLLYNR